MFCAATVIAVPLRLSTAGYKLVNVGVTTTDALVDDGKLFLRSESKVCVSCRFLCIFQFPATIFFLIFIFLLNLL